MNDFNPRIAQQMKELVRRWFTAESLAQLALSFIEDKLQESIKFGQLTVIHYHMFEGNNGDVFKAAAGVELFVLASDILDDLQDQDAPSKIWMQVPLPAALHVASSLLTLSQQAMLESAEGTEQQAALAAMMNEQLLYAANGQMTDLMNEIPDEESYLNMVKQKSAALLVLACMAGVMLAGRPWHASVAEYATELGISAQIRNDLRDLLRWDDKSDFLQRKRSLLTLFLIEGAGEEERWIVDYYEGRLDRAAVANRQPMFAEACERSGAVLYGSVMSRMHYNRFEEIAATVHAGSSWLEILLAVFNEKAA